MHDVFTACADPTRRALLGRLRDRGPLSVRGLTEGLPMSRQAVTKHLDVLADAGLLEIQVVGRERMHVLRAAPLQEMHRWLASHSAEWDERLTRLSHHLDGAPDDRLDDH